MPYDRLSSLDGSFLRLERLETPMHVGALSVFEGEPFFNDDRRFRLREARDLVASRLHLIPRFRKRIQSVPLDAGEPIWVDDPRFDIGYHVRLTALPAPGTRDQLLALFERVQSQMLDRTRPLWELWFVEGLEGGHVALIQKTHHALVDGVSGVDVATVLLDFQPEPTVLDPPPWRPEPAPTPARLLIDTLREYVAVPQSIADATRRATEVPRRAVDRIAELARSLSTFGEGGIVAPKTSLNHPVSGRSRRFGLVRVPLDDVKTIRRAFGGTINDVVLAGVGGGLARLLDAREELFPELVLKIFCPVSVRDDSQAHAARQPCVRHVHPAARRRARPGRAAVRRAAHDDRPQGARAGRRRSRVAQPHPVRGADAPRPRGAARAPSAVGEPRVHERPGTPGAAVLPGRPDARGVPDGAAVAEPQPRRSRSCRTAARCTSGCSPIATSGPTSTCSKRASTTSFAELTKLARDATSARETRERATEERVSRSAASEPMVMEVWEWDACDIADAIRAGSLTSREVLETHLERIKRLDPELNCVCYLDADAARARADEIDAEVAAGGDPGPLAGVPMGVKELASGRRMAGHARVGRVRRQRRRERRHRGGAARARAVR